MPKRGAASIAIAKSVAWPIGILEATEKNRRTKKNRRMAFAATAAHGSMPNVAKPKNARAVDKGACGGPAIVFSINNLYCRKNTTSELDSTAYSLCSTRRSSLGAGIWLYVRTLSLCMCSV